MNIDLHPGRALTLTALAVTLLSVAGSASAASVTYNFTQTGFNEGSVSGVLDGTFTATPEANGNIAATDLSSFQAIFKETVNGTPQNFVFNSVNDFSYSASNGLSFSAGSLAEGIIVCSGSTDVNAVCFDFTSPLSPRSNQNGFFEDLPNFPTSLTPNTAVVTLAGSPTTATPEPASSALLGGAGLLLIGAGRLNKRIRAHASRED